MQGYGVAAKSGKESGACDHTMSTMIDERVKEIQHKANSQSSLKAREAAQRQKKRLKELNKLYSDKCVASSIRVIPSLSSTGAQPIVFAYASPASSCKFSVYCFCCVV